MSIFTISLEASLFILAIIVLRTLTLHRLPKKTFVFLWGIALLKLLLPFSISSKWSILNSIKALAPKNQAKTAAISVLSPFSGTDRLTSVETVSVPTAVWLVGAAILFLFFLWSYLRRLRQFKQSLPLTDQPFVSQWQQEHPLLRKLLIRISDQITSPLTYGLLRPVILLPKEMDWSNNLQLRYILEHEESHIRRFDAFWKLLLTAALCLHWFNPLVWLMLLFANRDLEMVCDERIILQHGTQAKSTYALLLIHMQEKKQRGFSFYNSFSQNSIEERVVSIMKIKKTSLIGIFAAVVLVAGTTTVFATTAENKLTAVPSAEVTYLNKMEMEDGNATAEGRTKLVTTDEADMLTKDEFKTWIEKQKTTLKKNATEGKITQAEADQTIENYEAMLNTLADDAKVSVGAPIDGESNLTIFSAVSASSDAATLFSVK